MNYLELCTKVHNRADIPATGLASVTGQVGILLRVVSWVEDAWKEIQLAERWWLFRLESGSASLGTGVASYDVATFMPSDFSYFWPNSIYIKDAGTNVGQLSLMSWEDYRSQYLHETLVTGVPTTITVSHNGNIYFNTIPDKDYTIDFDYQRIVQNLAANNDIPTLPVDYHDVIWLRALAMYGEHYGAPEVYQPASLTLDEKMDIMSSTFLPKVAFRDNVYYGST